MPHMKKIEETQEELYSVNRDAYEALLVVMNILV